MSADIIGLLAGVILTLLVFSYLLGDTPLFRLAQAIFVGVAVGYATVVAIDLVLLPRLVVPLANDPVGNSVLIIPLILGLLLLSKLRTAWAPVGNLSIAFLFGVGGALAIGGALGGALVPQAGATILSLSGAQGWDSVLNNLLLVVGTIGALLSFRFMTGGTRPAGRLFDAVAQGWGQVGRLFILFSFGAIFAGTAVSRISILIGRVSYLIDAWHQIVR
jgi:hypothetical protein